MQSFEPCCHELKNAQNSAHFSAAKPLEWFSILLGFLPMI
jgi:hypothetical protein